jgi:tetratricopeptide (TPR) repeat protein
MPEKTRLDMILDMLKAEPNDEFLNYGLALEYAGAGRLEEAAAAFRRIVDAVNPRHSASYLQLGQLLARLNRIDEAREVFTRGIAAAEAAGDLHPAGEMRAFLSELE